MRDVALLIIYNHQYNQNIEVIENIYKHRFTHIFHLVPFYTGYKSNVITVYENSHYFHGYIAQGFKSFFNKQFAHYFFIADDLILNPQINEQNYSNHFNLLPDSCFLPGFIQLHEKFGPWLRSIEAYKYNLDLLGVEARDQLPKYDTAVSAFKKFNLEIKPLSINQIWKKPTSANEWINAYFKEKHLLKCYIKDKFKPVLFNTAYPIVGSYSDVFIVSSAAIHKFSHYCGVFAATQLFVELSVPTSLVLSADSITTESILKKKGLVLWEKEEFIVLDKYKNDLTELLRRFPEDYLYIHPIKLSQWKTI